MKAIILLGSHGAGKDTVASALIEQYPKCFFNAKFSRLLKEIVGNAFYANVKQLENKSWRQSVGMFGVSPLDVLNALFYGSNYVPALAESIISSCLEKIPDNTIPIFTDIRRDKELERVLETYTEDKVVIIRLLRSSSTPDDTDNYLNTSTLNFTHVNNDGDIKETIEEVLKLLCLEPPEPVYKIHMYYDRYNLNVSPKHSPLDYTSTSFDHLVRNLKEVFPESDSDLLLELTSETLTSALNLGLKPYLDKSTMPIESYVELTSSFPKSLVRYFREKAKLIWHYRIDRKDELAHLVEPEDEVVEYDR